MSSLPNDVEHSSPSMLKSVNPSSQTETPVGTEAPKKKLGRLLFTLVAATLSTGHCHCSYSILCFISVLTFFALVFAAFFWPSSSSPPLTDSLVSPSTPVNDSLVDPPHPVIRKLIFVQIVGQNIPPCSQLVSVVSSWSSSPWKRRFESLVSFVFPAWNGNAHRRELTEAEAIQYSIFSREVSTTPTCSESSWGNATWKLDS